MVIVINPRIKAVSGTGKEKIYRKGQFQRSSNFWWRNITNPRWLLREEIEE